MRLLALLLLVPGLAAAPAAAQVVTAADGTRSLTTEVWIPATPAQVWEAVTTAEGWKRWAVPLAWQIAPDLIETSYEPGATPGGVNNIQHRLLERVPNTRLVFRTVKTPAGFPHADVLATMKSTMELTPENGGTRLRLTGSGYPVGAAGDALLGFFEKGNQQTLDSLAARFGLAPLDFLAGHCWKGVLPTGDDNIHCFTREGATIRDRHEVLKAGKKVYGGDTIYAWDGTARTIRFAYTGMGGTDGKGTAWLDGEELDFGTTEYASGGGKIAISTRWVRVAPNAYEARDVSPGNARFTHTVRYTRVEN